MVLRRDWDDRLDQLFVILYFFELKGAFLGGFRILFRIVSDFWYFHKILNECLNVFISSPLNRSLVWWRLFPIVRCSTWQVWKWRLYRIISFTLLIVSIPVSSNWCLVMSPIALSSPSAPILGWVIAQIVSLRIRLLQFWWSIGCDDRISTQTPLVTLDLTAT